jgi:hypothetical protein
VNQWTDLLRTRLNNDSFDLYEIGQSTRAMCSVAGYLSVVSARSKRKRVFSVHSVQLGEREEDVVSTLCRVQSTVPK